MLSLVETFFFGACRAVWAHVGSFSLIHPKPAGREV